MSLITDAPALELLDVFTVVVVGNFTLGGLPVAIRGLCNIENVFLRVIIDLTPCVAFLLPVIVLTFWSPL